VIVQWKVVVRSSRSVTVLEFVPTITLLQSSATSSQSPEHRRYAVRW
jgi:hypothetical protein